MINELNKITQSLGNKLLEWKEDIGTQGHWEGSQFKAKADLMAHDYLESRLNKLSPNISVISEENLDSLVENRPNFYWLIDPIDGTASFANGFSGFVTQVALVEKNKVKIASVYAPLLKELYHAEKGKNSYLNGEKLSLKNKQKIESLIDNYPEPRKIAKNAVEELNIENYLECGSIGLKICKVAAGKSDLFIKDVTIRDWDIAPAHLILKEAGGELCCLNGKNFTYSDCYEHYGLIAASSEEIKKTVLNWYKVNFNDE